MTPKTCPPIYSSLDSKENTLIINGNKYSADREERAPLLLIAIKLELL